MIPGMEVWGNTPRNPKRTTDAALRPVFTKSGSPGTISSSKSATWVDLGADAAHEPIPKRWEAAKENGGTILDAAIGLRNGSEDDVAFVHVRRSASVYSGSLSLYARASC